jgi:hypothetical protein
MWGVGLPYVELNVSSIGPGCVAAGDWRLPAYEKTQTDLSGSDTRATSSCVATLPQSLAGQGSHAPANGRAFRVVSYFRKRLSQLVG